MFAQIHMTKAEHLEKSIYLVESVMAFLSLGIHTIFSATYQ